MVIVNLMYRRKIYNLKEGELGFFASHPPIKEIVAEVHSSTTGTPVNVTYDMFEQGPQSAPFPS